MELKGLSSFDFAVVTVRRSLSGVTTFSSVQFSSVQLSREAGNDSGVAAPAPKFILCEWQANACKLACGIMPLLHALRVQP